MICQAIYSSRAARPMDAAALEEILVDARRGNAARDVTGALVYADGVFLQILEGEREVLRRLLDSIRADSRHESMKVFHVCEVAERAFAHWRMAYLSPDAGEMSRWAGLDGTQTIDGLLAEIHRDPARVPRILVSIVQALAAQSGKRRGPGPDT